MAEAVVGSKSLKAGYANTLFLIMAGNVAAFYLAQNTGHIGLGEWSKVARAVVAGWPAGVGTALTGLLAMIVSGDFKAKLVFLRWKDPLPGSRAFTELAERDPRVNMDELRRKFSPLPTDPRTQNLLWYNLYHRVEDHPGVADIHRQFLFARDYAFMSMLLIVTLGVAADILIEPAGTAVLFVALLILQWAVATLAAQDRGNRLVTTVLAHNTTTKGDNDHAD